MDQNQISAVEAAIDKAMGKPATVRAALGVNLMNNGLRLAARRGDRDAKRLRDRVYRDLMGIGR